MLDESRSHESRTWRRTREKKREREREREKREGSRMHRDSRTRPATPCQRAATFPARAVSNVRRESDESSSAECTGCPEFECVKATRERTEKKGEGRLEKIAKKRKRQDREVLITRIN